MPPPASARARAAAGAALPLPSSSSSASSSSATTPLQHRGLFPRPPRVPPPASLLAKAKAGAALVLPPSSSSVSSSGATAPQVHLVPFPMPPRVPPPPGAFLRAYRLLTERCWNASWTDEGEGRICDEIEDTTDFRCFRILAPNRRHRPLYLGWSFFGDPERHGLALKTRGKFIKRALQLAKSGFHADFKAQTGIAKRCVQVLRSLQNSSPQKPDKPPQGSIAWRPPGRPVCMPRTALLSRLRGGEAEGAALLPDVCDAGACRSAVLQANESCADNLKIIERLMSQLLSLCTPCGRAYMEMLKACNEAAGTYTYEGQCKGKCWDDLQTVASICTATDVLSGGVKAKENANYWIRECQYGTCPLALQAAGECLADIVRAYGAHMEYRACSSECNLHVCAVTKECEDGDALPANMNMKSTVTKLRAHFNTTLTPCACGVGTTATVVNTTVGTVSSTPSKYSSLSQLLVACAVSMMMLK
ncbi:unnamed protein product [Polarella glacialis]|uniref:Uncharacterized protein n=1 Tax=Polarella glacialis TaxID=89957 RepID=A0A813HR09_POLGL|nr:unnamed protein product [Polarella glacialis]